MLLTTTARALVAGLVAAALSAASVAQSGGDKVNVTGTWIFNVDTTAGSGTPTMTFKQEGEKLTGRYTGQLGESDITGSMKGNAITFTFTGEAQGITFEVVYTGTVDKDTMKGTLRLGDVADGTFTATRKAAGASESLPSAAARCTAQNAQTATAAGSFAILSPEPLSPEPALS